MNPAGSVSFSSCVATSLPSGWKTSGNEEKMPVDRGRGFGALPELSLLTGLPRVPVSRVDSSTGETGSRLLMLCDAHGAVRGTEW